MNLVQEVEVPGEDQRSHRTPVWLPSHIRDWGWPKHLMSNHFLVVFFLKKYFFIFIYYLERAHINHGICVEVKGQLAGAASLLSPRGSWRSNSGRKVWKHVPAEPSYGPSVGDFHWPVQQSGTSVTFLTAEVEEIRWGPDCKVQYTHAVLSNNK